MSRGFLGGRVYRQYIHEVFYLSLFKTSKTIFQYNFVFRQTTFYFGHCYFCNQPCEYWIVFHHGKTKQIIEVLKCFGYSKVPTGVFLLIIFIIIWNSVYSLTGTGAIWCNLFNSFLSSLLALACQVGIYLTSRCYQITIKGNKIFNSYFIVFMKLSKKTQVLHLLHCRW